MAVAEAESGEQIFTLLTRLVGLMHAHFATVIADHGLPDPQAKALLRLARPVPMRELARLLHCDASAITGIVDALEDSGLVERRVDPRDRRVKYVVPTRRGIRTRLAINKKLFEWLPGVTTLPHQDRLLFRDLLARAMSHKNA